ncbi:MAG: GNAT family N-acetyltransferase [Geminicoccaceae bacterium]
MSFVLRPASTADADAIAAVFTASFRLLDFLPILHSEAEDRWFIEHVILKQCVVTAAEADDRIVSFIAVDDQEVRLLHTHPGWIGRGAGSQLIELVQASGIAALELWSFQANSRARRFYEARGFRAIRFTDGRNNEEKMPDVRYRWDREQAALKSD